MSVVAERSTIDRLTKGRLVPGRTLPHGLRMGREHLPVLCREFGFTKGAEIGVWKGAFSAAFCEANPAMHMLAVDPWVSYPAWVDAKNKSVADGLRLMEESYQIARARLAPLNATIVRTFSTVAALEVPDRSLDVVYIDGNHGLEAVYEDLLAWVPKVRSGGLVGGHDYRVFANKPNIHVVEAVQAYTKAHAIDPWFVLTGDRTPSFLWVVN